MTSKIKSPVMLMLLAILSTCVLSSAVISGEHPWDSDRYPDTLTTPPPVVDTVTVVIGTTRSGNGTGTSTATTTSASSDRPAFADVMQRFLFKLVWDFAQKYQLYQQSSSQVDRW